MNIVIIGCGWLGRIVGESLVKEGHNVFGTYRSEKTKSKIENYGIIPIGIKNDKISQNSISKYGNIDVVLIFLPVNRKEKNVDYSKTISDLIEGIEDNTKVIFSSSIGIYPKKSGVYNEEYVFSEEDKKSPLYLAENLLRVKFKSNLTVLRLAGLIGPNRHPIKQLSEKSIHSSGSSNVHLIHSGDISKVVSKIIENYNYGHTFNLVYPSTISKKEYYKSIAFKYNLKPPFYGEETEAVRIILSNKIVNTIGFEYELDIELFGDRLEINK